MAQLEEELAATLADLIFQHVAAVTKPLRARIEELELKVVELQTKGVEEARQSPNLNVEVMTFTARPRHKSDKCLERVPLSENQMH
jgi:hypothetical protein